VNVYGPIRTTQAVLPSMRAQGSGTIVNVSSQGSFDTAPYLGIYYSTKWALECLSESLAAELASFGIRVLLPAPGALATDFTDVSAGSSTGGKLSEPYKGTAAEMVRHYISNVEGYKAMAFSPSKTAQRIVEAVDGTGMLEGREVGLRLPLGSTAEKMMQRAKSYVAVGEALADVDMSTK